MAPAATNQAKKAIVSTAAAKPAKKAVEAPKATKKATTAAAAAPATKVKRVSQRKAYHSAQFRRPHTKRTAAPAKPDNNTKVVKSSVDQFRVVKYPLMTDKTMNKMEKNNTLTFIVDNHSNKTQIKRAIYKLYKVKSVKVNTLIRPDGEKKAYVRLARAHDAMDVAGKMGIM
jgi:large subunit ribosomal protein L23Ae